MERPTFSPFWHRLRATKPRLRAHVQVTRQRYRGRRWHVAHDPTSNQFYRLSPVAYDFVATLDGVRTVDEAWRLSLEKFGDKAPTQHEVIELIGQLYNSNLLSVDASPETEQLLRRGRDRVKKRLMQQAASLMYFKVRVFNPDALLTAVEPIFRPVLNRWGFVAWLLLVLFAVVSLVPQWARLVSGVDSVTAPSAWPYMIGTYIVLKLWHELGHGVICKRFGGQVPELGAMLLVLLPSPYVDASSAWSFPSKWQRIAVGMGGMFFELTAAAVCAFIWLNTPGGTVLNQVAYYVMLTSGISTVLFNGNPLMRFDGYYILSDWLEIPNLSQRATTLIKNVFLKHVYRVENVRPVTQSRSEWWIMLVYGVLAMFYRILIFFGILTWLLGQLFGLGIILAAWSFAAWFLIPTGMFVRWLASSPQLSDKRGRAVLTTLALAAALAVLLGGVPLPDWRRAEGVVESRSRVGVFAGVDGVIVSAPVGTGQRVKKGDIVAVVESPELEATLAQARAERAEYLVRLRETRSTDEPAAGQVVARQIEALEKYVAELERRKTELVVLAPTDGVMVSGDPARMVGMWVKRGQGLGEIVDTDALRIHALMSQGDANWLFGVGQEGRTRVTGEAFAVELRLASDLGRVIDGGEGGKATAVPSGQKSVPHAALMHAGGGEVEPDVDAEGRPRGAKHRRFSVLIEPAGDLLAASGAMPGERVYVRFTLPSRSLAWQVMDRVRKTLQGRVNL